MDELEDDFGPLFDLRTCRVCGCTDDEACEGGCTWVEEDLCSRCAQPHRARITPRQVA